MTRGLRLAVALLSAGFLAAHLAALPRTLEDQDSINFALAVERFDVSGHRPHPPGYPVYVAISKISTAAFRAVTTGPDRRDRAAAQGLAIWGVIAGTVAPFVFVEFWLAIGLAPVLAVLASALAIATPLFWFSASRPLTDVPGLVAAVAVQTLCIRGLRRLREPSAADRLPREWIWAAAGAGVIIGLRSQTLWLTAPLLCWGVGELILHRRMRDALLVTGAAAVGVLVWAVPMVWLTGGIDAYLAAVRSQGHDDLRDVQLLSTTPTLKMLKLVLARTFVWPWAGEPQPAGGSFARYVGSLVALLGAVGAGRLIAGRSRTLAALLLAFWLYVVFHLTFQETLTLRYALPVIVPLAGLATIALAGLSARVAAGVTAVLVVLGVAIAQPALRAYSAAGDPFFRGFQQMADGAPGLSIPPMLQPHHQVWWPASRVMDWYRPAWDMGPQPHPGDREWLSLVREWSNGADRPAWFLTDVTRTDVALFDPRSRELTGRYAWPPHVRALLPGARLDRYDWWTLQPPMWMLGSGWALTPEIAGMTEADRSWPHQKAAQALLRRSATPTRVLIGGRRLKPGESAATIVIAFDGTWSSGPFAVRPSPNWFVQWIELPASRGASPYAMLTVSGGSPDVPIGLEQFDAAPIDQPIVAFIDGWHEPEGDRTTGRLWRWTSAHSEIEIRGGSGDLTLTVSGESPLRDFDRAPSVVIKAGAAELGRFEPAAGFTQHVVIPSAALAAAGGRVAIDTNLTFVPADRGQSQDRRQLGLRITSVQVRNK